MNDKELIIYLRYEVNGLETVIGALRGKLAERDAEIKALREIVFDLSKKLRECSAPPPLN